MSLDDITRLHIPPLSKITRGLGEYIVEPNGAQENPPSKNTDASFAIFSKLPIELRIQIWRHALEGPTIRRICPSGTGTVHRLVSTGWACKLLQTSKESRRTALERYSASLKLCSRSKRSYQFFQLRIKFGSRTSLDMYHCLKCVRRQCQGKVRFDGNNDTIYIENFHVVMRTMCTIGYELTGRPLLLWPLHWKWAEKIQHLAVDLHNLRGMLAAYIMKNLVQFKNLKSLTLLRAYYIYGEVPSVYQGFGRGSSWTTETASQIMELKHFELEAPELWWRKIDGIEMNLVDVRRL